MKDSLLIVTIERETYGCRLCQAMGEPCWHLRGDPLFADHLAFQGKHSFGLRRETKYFLVVPTLAMLALQAQEISREIAYSYVGDTLLANLQMRLPLPLEWA